MAAVMKRRVIIPKSVAEQALIRLMRVGDRLWRQSDEWFHRWELTDNHYNVLRILNGAGGPIQQVEIGRRMLSSRANVTKVVDRLEEMGLVRREGGTDRRVKWVELTPDGMDFLEGTSGEVIGFAEQALRRLTGEEQKVLLELLEKLLENET
jgi:DNA-binding MarR family transcriptional regulator